MLTAAELKQVAREKLHDATALYRMKRYDSAVYLAGYAVEISLKFRVCQLMGWPNYPKTNGEFNQKINEKFKFLKNHNLELLLAYSGAEQIVKDGTGPYK